MSDLPFNKPNKWQGAICQTYASGIFAWLADSTNWQEEARVSGDWLFYALMEELADVSEDDEAAALNRIELVQGQMDDARDAIINAERLLNLKGVSVAELKATAMSVTAGGQIRDAAVAEIGRRERIENSAVLVTTNGEDKGPTNPNWG